MTPDQKADVAKGAGAWAAVGISNWLALLLDTLQIKTWGEASQFAAFVLTVLLILDFFYRRVIRRYLEHKWPRRFKRRSRTRRADFVDSTDNTPLGRP